MSTAVSIVILIAVVTAAGLLRDSLRTNAVTRWAKSRGFTVVPKSEHDTKQLMAWAGRFHPDSCGHWGNVLRGGTGGRETVIAEHEEKRLTSPDRWHTLAVTRVPGLQMQAIRIIAAGSPVVRGVTDAASAPGRAAREHLGIEVTEKPEAHPVGKGMWAVDTTDAGARAYWSGEIGAAAIDAWPHDAELAAIDDCVLVRIPGLINAERLTTCSPRPSPPAASSLRPRRECRVDKSHHGMGLAPFTATEHRRSPTHETKEHDLPVVQQGRA